MRLLSWSITRCSWSHSGGGFQMDEAPSAPQVLSWPISSICAVISNYWSLIEVRVEYSSSICPGAHEYPPLTNYTKWYSRRSNVSSQSSSPALLVRSFQPPQFEETAGILWCLTGLAMGHCQCCIWQGTYSCQSRDTEIIFYIAPCSK